MSAKPGDLCRFIADTAGHVVAVEHVKPCSQAGLTTDIRTGRIIR